MSVEKTINQFLDEEYKDYAMYVISNRAIPSLVDGQKSSTRKILYVADRTTRREKCKVNVLAGRIIADAQYMHGNVSAEDAIVGMAQKFKNNLPLLEDIGTYGSIRNPYAASSRYISTRISDEFDSLFKDDFLLEYNEVDGKFCEPKFYLPIIPILLVNGSSGIAVGFACNILQREPIDIINACLSFLNEKKFKLGPVSIPQFSGDVEVDPNNPKRWELKGRFERVRNSIHVRELPPSMTYEKYEKLLDHLLNSKKIKSYEDMGKGSIHYFIKPNGELDPYKDLKLSEWETENFTTLDEFGKLKIFESAEEIVEYFVNFRLGFYTKRKEWYINKISNELKLISNRGKFIKLILDGKIQINNKPKSEIIGACVENGLETIDGDYDYLLKMPIYSLTKELFDKMKVDFKAKKAELEELKSADPRQMYISDLVELKKKLK
jgi:DNA gyrase/topoisomerase IV subunit A